MRHAITFFFLLFLYPSAHAAQVTAGKLSLNLPDNLFQSLTRTAITTFQLNDAKPAIIFASKSSDTNTGRPVAVLNFSYLPLDREPKATEIDRKLFLQDIGKEASEGNETAAMTNNVLARKILFQNFDLGGGLVGTRFHVSFQPLDKSVAFSIDGYFMDSSANDVDAIISGIQCLTK